MNCSTSVYWHKFWRGVPLVGGVQVNWLVGIGLATLVSTIMSFYKLGAYPLNFDESFDWWASSLTLPDIVYVTSRNILHPPLYYFLTHGWMQLAGSSEFALRTLPAVFTAGMVPLIAQIGWLAGGRRLGLAAAWLWAVLPLPVAMAHYARNYALAGWLAALAVWLMILAVKTRRTGSWIGLALANILLLYTHYGGAFILLAQIVVFILYLRVDPGIFWRGMLVQLCTALGLAPWVYVVMSVDWSHLAGGYTPPLSWERGLQVLQELTVYKHAAPAWMVVSLLPLAAATLMLARRNRFLRPATRVAWQMLWVIGLGIPLLLTAVSLARPILEVRYLYVCYWALSMIWAAGLLAFPARWHRYLAAGLLLAALGVGLFEFYRSPQQFADDWPGAAQFIARRSQGDEALIIAFRGGQGYHGILYYYRGQAPFVAYDLAPEDGIEHFPETDAQGRPVKRMWVVFYMIDSLEGVPQMFKPAPDSPWRIAGEQGSGDVFVLEYQRSDGAR